MPLVVEQPPSTFSAHAKPAGLAHFATAIPLPRGPQWYLVAYRWLLVAASLYTVAVTWNVWQDRSDPNWHPWSFATPANSNAWETRPSDSQLAPMLPVWDSLPQIDFGWLIVAAILSILIFPRAGLAALGTLLVASVFFDRTRLQPHYVLWFLMLATLPGVNAQLVGRANLIALWFWAGFHKLIIDFIKPDGMPGFRSEVIPNDLLRFFPGEHHWWTSHGFGMALGWVIAVTEVSLGILCFVPRARWVVAIAALGMHTSIIIWNCLGPHCNLLGWNMMLALAGFALILPWRESRLVTFRKSNWVAKIATLAVLLLPAAYYVNGIAAYLSYCIYVPNNPFAVLYRPGEEPKTVGFMGYEEVNFPLSPSHSILQAYFNKIRQPGDVMIVHDPRPWAESHGLNGRQYTDYGEFPRGQSWRYTYEDGVLQTVGSYINDMREGLWISWHHNGKMETQGVMLDDQRHGPWIQYHPNGNKLSLGSYDHGREEGLWTFWYSDGQKEMEGRFVDGQMDGVWTTWTPSGEPSKIEFHQGLPVVAP
ncbi:MAG TPA: toxin-antitoxin system YwqK family antitoxin [Pirellulales bacterium]|jgi:hypothetical protein|nr:toxin-antitoxin system YwqK family antitoxin [Pirellulales bacterium]